MTLLADADIRCCLASSTSAASAVMHLLCSQNMLYRVATRYFCWFMNSYVLFPL